MADRGEPVAVHADAGSVRAITRADGGECSVRATLESWRHPRFAATPAERMRVTQAYRVLLDTPDGPREATLHQYGAEHPDVWRMRLPAGQWPMRTIKPRIFVHDPEGAVAFLREVFGARGEIEGDRPAEIVIGDSTIMVSGTGERPEFPAFLYVYVDDVDAAYGRAVASGATSLEEPGPTPYGDRRAMVRDPFGNVFQIARST